MPIVSTPEAPLPCVLASWHCCCERPSPRMRASHSPAKLTSTYVGAFLRTTAAKSRVFAATIFDAVPADCETSAEKMMNSLLQYSSDGAVGVLCSQHKTSHHERSTCRVQSLLTCAVERAVSGSRPHSWRIPTRVCTWLCNQRRNCISIFPLLDRWLISLNFVKSTLEKSIQTSQSCQQQGALGDSIRHASHLIAHWKPVEVDDEQEKLEGIKWTS